MVAPPRVGFISCMHLGDMKPLNHSYSAASIFFLMFATFKIFLFAALRRRKLENTHPHLYVKDELTRKQFGFAFDFSFDFDFGFGFEFDCSRTQ